MDAEQLKSILSQGDAPVVIDCKDEGGRWIRAEIRGVGVSYDEEGLREYALVADGDLVKHPPPSPAVPVTPPKTVDW